MILGEKLTQARKAVGLTQADVAAKMNVSRQAVSRWESGQSKPSTERLLALGELYGVSIDQLLTQENKPSAKVAEIVFFIVARRGSEYDNCKKCHLQHPERQFIRFHRLPVFSLSDCKLNDFLSTTFSTTERRINKTTVPRLMTRNVRQRASDEALVPYFVILPQSFGHLVCIFRQREAAPPVCLAGRTLPMMNCRPSPLIPTGLMLLLFQEQTETFRRKIPESSDLCPTLL